MENKISVVFCSTKALNDKKDLIDNISDTCGYNVDIQMITNDGVSLTKVYNEVLRTSKNNIVIFIHDDVEFLKKGWGKSIVNLFENNKEYGIIGVAGSYFFDENATWWTYDEKYGQVLHRSEGKSWLTTFSPLLKNGELREVCVIDGLFIAIHKDRISSKFDEEFGGFNHYDTSFCLANYIDGKTKIGVTTDVRMAHNSVGKLKENWFENRELLNKKYKGFYPIKIKDDEKK